MSEQRRVLVVAAHPDDEILGCGGAVARHVAEGDEAHVLILAEGATSRDEKRDAAARAGDMAVLREAAAGAARAVGSLPPRFGGLPDNRMDGLEMLDVVKRVEAVVAEVQPQIVYTHHGGDLNIDHLVTHRAALTACRALPGASVRAIYAFETVSSTEWGSSSCGGPFLPQRYVDISRHLDAKMRAVDAYAPEMRPFPHARSSRAVVALARIRGAEAGVEAAEAFMVIRELA